MANVSKIIGVAKVLKNLKIVDEKVGVGIERGCLRGGLFLQGESQRIVPVDTGNLKNGARTRNIGGQGYKADVVVEYLAEYAVAVHENLQASHKSGKRAKYLEEPARLFRKEIIGIINKEAKQAVRGI
jgi:hypothetical protein